MKRIGLCLLLCLLTSCQTSQVREQPSPQADPQQEYVWWRGVNLAGAEFGAGQNGEGSLPGNFGQHYIYPNQDEVDYFQSKGMNIIRLPFRWERLQPSLYNDFDSAELARIKTFVEETTAKDMRVILDPHNYAGYYTGNTQGRLGIDLPDSAFADFWRRLALEFKTNDLVIFGLMNEPIILSGEAWVEAANAAIAAIRSVEADQLILVPGVAYSGAHSWMQNWYGTPNGETTLELRDPYNWFMIEVHQYLDEDYSGTNSVCQSAPAGSEALQDFTNWLRTHELEGFLGEFSIGHNQNCAAALEDMLDYLESNADVWRGWTYWAAGPWWVEEDQTLDPFNGQDRLPMSVLDKYLPTSTPDPDPEPDPDPTGPGPSATGDGLRGEYFNDDNLNDWQFNRVDAYLDFAWETYSPDARLNNDGFSVRWRGEVEPKHTGGAKEYTFILQADDGVRLWLNGDLVVDAWEDRGLNMHTATLTMQAGQRYDVKLEYRELTGVARLKVDWKAPGIAQETLPQVFTYSYSESPPDDPTPPSPPATAGTVWRSTNPGGGGAFNSPIITSEGNWAVGSDLGGIYLSADQGASWQAIGALQGLTSTHVASLSAHPNSKIIAGMEGGVYVMNSDGSNVRLAWSDPGNPAAYVSAVAVTANPNVVYAAVHPRYNQTSPYLIRSNDAGESWFATGSNLPSTLRITAIRTHPVDPDGVWVVSGIGRGASGPKAAYFSTDGGTTFFQLAAGFGDVIDLNYALDSSNLNRMYLTTSQGGQGGFYMSADTGFNWQAVTSYTAPGCSNGAAGVILSDPDNANHVRLVDLNTRNPSSAGTYLWESWDGGVSFSCAALAPTLGWSKAAGTWGMGLSYQGILQTIGYSPGRSDTVLWVNNQIVFKSLDGGSTWQDTVTSARGGNWRSVGIDNAVPVAIAPSEADPNLVYAGYMDMGLWRSDDGGQSWKDLNTVPYSHNWLGFGGNTLTVLPDPVRDSVVWAQMGGDLEACGSPCAQPLHLLKSTNRGDTWTELTAGLPYPLRRLEGLSLAYDSATDYRWLYVVANGDVFLSKNDGASWEQVLACGSCFKTWYTDMGVYAMSAAKLYRSWQGGVAGSWAEVPLPGSITSGLTAGQHWLFNNWTYQGLSDAAFDGSTGSIWLSVFGYGKGLYRSYDWGGSWTLVKADNFARSVERDLSTGEVLLGSSSAMQAGGYSAQSNGVAVSSDGTGNWTTLNDGLAYPFATFISVSEEGDRWLISPGQGVLRFE